MKVFPLCTEKEDWVVVRNQPIKEIRFPEILGCPHVSNIIEVHGDPDLVSGQDTDPGLWKKLHLFVVSADDVFTTKFHFNVAYTRVKKSGRRFYKTAIPRVTVNGFEAAFAMRRGPSPMQVAVMANKSAWLSLGRRDQVISDIAIEHTPDCVILF